MPFVELHARSAFSFLRGSSHPEALVARAQELGMDSIAVTDRDGLYGTARVHHKAEELGIKGIVGAEITLEDESVLPLLVSSRDGYQNLCRMLTRAKLRAPKGQSRVTWAELEEHSADLIALTGEAEGPLVRAIESSDRHAPLEVLKRLQHIFGGEGRLAIEVQRHRLRKDQRRIKALQELAGLSGLPLVATNGVLYAHMEGRLLHDAFTALRHHTTLDDAGLRLAANSQRYLKSEKEMRELFADMPEAVDAAAHIAEKALSGFTLQDLGYKFPEYPVEDGHSQESFLKERAYEGARERLGSLSQKTPNGVTIRQQIEDELSLISELGFSGYFLVVWGIVRFCRENNITVQGRGSAANSVVCFSLGITNANPTEHKLLFSRFLSRRQKSWPDIDLDLPSGDRRESVIQEMYRQFAPHGAAMTANVITYRGRSAMREMGKVIGLSEDVISRYSDYFANGDFHHTMGVREQIRNAGLPESHPRLPALLRLYHAAYGLPRHLGQHSGGMVLCTNGLDTIVPLEPASMPGRVVVQWDKDDCEDLGLVKVDLLGLGMMAVLEDTMNMCRERGVERAMELHRVPQGDPATYAMIQKADTVGVFQIESRAQMATLPRLKPKNFYDLVIEVAIIRPGPIVGKMVHPYLQRRAGREKVDCIHEKLEPVLLRTLGVPLFQEQVLEMSMKIAGFDGAQAEELRRALSFHRSEERMAKVMKKLYAGMEEREVEQSVQERVAASIRSFALYGFPESHAISFALLAYASAWFRVHRLPEMTAALLNNQPMGFYSSSTLVRDAKLHGLRVLPACVTHSEVVCTVIDDSAIRLGLNQLRGVSRGAAEKIVTERQRKPWESIEDFLLRCHLSRDERRVLAKSGALNTLTPHRRSALWEVEREREHDLFSYSAKLREEAAGYANTHTSDSPLLLMNPVERLEADYSATGLTVGPHPMAMLRQKVPEVMLAKELPHGTHGQRVIIGGMVICRQRPGTAKGHVFVSLEDETGIANAFVPSPLFEARRLVITQEPYLRIIGRLQIVDDVTSVYALQVEPLVFPTTAGPKSHDFH
ncbi:DnaE-like error-prone DNA polymerase [Roseimicrobium gellanilyticum]|uniref:DNA-directed DNA polymerase n=1 Tax=Roseimicrobium gellanilyticum TaxID=748857 RepID=A0A366HNE4_9BACT|nr:error-prone DNA polymerase [Roseimicrobium gellanilyticum]RBP45007.1 DnaE-like error-prone DNA polymerase [Roseimicrobium gellanilyticum]